MHPTPTFLTPFDLSPVQIFPPSDVIDSIHTEGSGALRRRQRTLVEEHGSVFTRSVRRNPSLVAPMVLDVRTRTTTTTTDRFPSCWVRATLAGLLSTQTSHSSERQPSSNTSDRRWRIYLRRCNGLSHTEPASSVYSTSNADKSVIPAQYSRATSASYRLHSSLRRV